MNGKVLNELRLDILLKKLDREMIQKIHEDPLLNKDEYNGLFIANASKRLFTPTEEHQLFAKGIVYDEEFNLVSLPLVKMYNLGEKEVGDALARDLKMTAVPEKWDGTMIQVFQHKGELIFTTRSKFFTEPFCEWAQEILSQEYPYFAPEVGLTYVFELIHPENRIVTDYGDLRGVVLTSVFDVKARRYLPMQSIRARYGSVVYVGADLFDHSTSFDEVVDAVRCWSHDSEGVVLLFENEHEVLHRVKVKSAHYIELFRQRYHCTYKVVRELLLGRWDLHTWPQFWGYIVATNAFAEELEDFLRGYFDRFIDWKMRVTTIYCEAMNDGCQFVISNPDLLQGSVDDLCRSYSKVENKNPLVFTFLRGKLTWDYVAKTVKDEEDVPSELSNGHDAEGGH